MRKIILLSFALLMMPLTGYSLNKSELLSNLLSKDWIGSVGSPTLLETKPDGSKLYSVNYREKVGNAGVYRNIQFYVVDEGGGGETAFYKDREPMEANSDQSSLKAWLINAIDNNPNNYKGIQILWASERWEMIIYTILEGTPLVQKTYYFRKGVGSPTEINNFNPELLRSLIRQ
jgi:hypothetical protein